MRYASHWQCHAGHSHYRHSSELLQVCATGSAVTMSVTGQRRQWQYYGSPSYEGVTALPVPLAVAQPQYMPVPLPVEF